MPRVYNFSAGPSMLPESVLQKAKEEMLDYNGCGQSVMEMSHRSPMFKGIITEAESLLRDLMHIPDTYAVLFLQGGASLQFTMVPHNLLSESGTGVYVNTGAWSKKAIAEAKKLGEVHVAASSEESNFTVIPGRKCLSNLPPKTDYIHITTNNTIYGTRWPEIPDTGNTPLISDMSSNILSEIYNVEKFGIIYAGAQKNIGPAGVTVVIIRKELAGKALPNTPTMLDYATHIKSESMFNTPPCYSIYVAKLVFEWLREMGGVETIQERNIEKAGLLYEFLDNSSIYRATVEEPFRSRMNIPFVCTNADFHSEFLSRAESVGLVNLKGHRSVGGMRASMYNAMPREGVRALVDFMKSFEMEHR